MTGAIGVLNVGAGDTKLTFDKNNPAETIRSGRIVQDMLRRGFVLLVETTDAKGEKAFTRVHEFDEKTAEYIIADFDPQAARVEVTTYGAGGGMEHSTTEETGAETEQGEAGEAAPEAAETAEPGAARLRALKRTKRVPASETSGIAVARSAGG